MGKLQGSTMPAATDILRSTFGFHGFREGQESVVDKLVAGQSVLAVFPTGAGKSLCYQLPALMFQGLTLVVSPLIALMKDQIDFLTGRGIAAARLDSTLTLDETRSVHRQLREHTLKLLYVSPERLSDERFRATLRPHKIALMAIDEAHCISEWGHNFRPEYMKLALAAKDLGVVRVLALTATAPPSVAADIARAFDIDSADIVRTGFYRPNLTVHLTPCTPNTADDLLIRRISERPKGATIVYVSLQRTAERVAERLTAAGMSARAYHAGLESEQRAEIQDWFMASPDAVVVATIAFGMGIDKSDIRAIYHYNLPKSLENYAQEIGRSGRDGRPSVCEAFLVPEDRIVLENFIYGDTPTASAILNLLVDILGRGNEFEIAPYELSGRHDIRPLVLDTLLTYLELEGVIRATSTYFAEYKFQPNRPSAEILKDFDPERAAFLKKIFQRATKALTWFTIDVPAAVAATGEPRERIVAALNFLEEKGDLTLKVAQSRQAYRRLKPLVDGQTIAAKLHARFSEREVRDVARVSALLKMAEYPGCWSRYLASYFGDSPAPDCGHCGWCLWQRPGPLPPPTHPPMGLVERQLVHELQQMRYPALATPRQVTRFLCGLSSPATSKAKLTKLPTFGRLDAVPFGEVLMFVEKAWRNGDKLA
jgi:ATP-dependent DNA helicase RecQ